MDWFLGKMIMACSPKKPMEHWGKLKEVDGSDKKEYRAFFVACIDSLHASPLLAKAASMAFNGFSM